MSENALVPEYLNQFQCIGSQCEDTCCAFWNINIDQDTYRQYQNVQHIALKKQFKTDVLVNKGNKRTKENYAVMKLDTATGLCCFNSKGLCSIQAELGESYLSKTCATYPRKYNEINGEQEISATLSCPEAARLALLNKGGIEFSYIEAANGPNTQWNARVYTDTPKATPTAKYFWKLRIISLEIIQNRNFPLSQRFMQLAVLADRVDEAISANKAAQIEEIIEQFRLELAQVGGISDISIFPSNHEYQLRFLNDLLTTIVEQKLWHNSRYKECLDQYIQGMQRTQGSNKEESVYAFNKSFTTYCKPFTDEHEYIFENYLVNYIYATLFPMSTKQTMFEKVRYIGILYSLIRLHLIGMSEINQGLNEEIVVKLIQSFTKNYEHLVKFKELIEEKCRLEQITLGHLSLLIMI